MCFSQHLSHTVAMILSHFFTEAAAFRIMDPHMRQPARSSCRSVSHFLHSSGFLSIASQKVQMKIKKKNLFTSLSHFPLYQFFVPQENHCKTLPYAYMPPEKQEHSM